MTSLLSSGNRAVVDTSKLPPIPVIDTSAAFPIETLEAAIPRAEALLAAASAKAPAAVLRLLDAASRQWLVRHKNPLLGEIDAIAARLNRPGVYFFSVNYEWACTCRVGAAHEGASARLTRVLDWRTPGLGRTIIAARVACEKGPFVSLTWPGYTGVIQGVAKDRFAAALNQAPMKRRTGSLLIDWAINRSQVWQCGDPSPAHVLRRVFETASTFAEARQHLIDAPLSSPAIFSLAGVTPSELAIIERSERDARVFDGPGVAANHWQSPLWRGRPRGNRSVTRARDMHLAAQDLEPGFPWLAAPILNPDTRLVMVADARLGRCVAQGFEAMEPATVPLVLDL